MPNIGSYKSLFKKLFLVELVGENFYEGLAAREKGEVLKAVYQRLEVNERETKMLIEQELRVTDQDALTLSHKTMVVLLNLFYRILPLSLLKSILRNILNRRMYSKLSEQYRDSNPELWDALVRHEHLQHELLTPFWNQPTGGK
jgi:hypothetical protein